MRKDGPGNGTERQKRWGQEKGQRDSKSKKRDRGLDRDGKRSIRERGREAERRGGQERERKIRTGGRTEIAKKAWGGQQDGEGANKSRGRGQDRRI